MPLSPLSVAKEYTRKVPHRQDGVIMKVLTKSYYIVIQERKIKRVGEREEIRLHQLQQNHNGSSLREGRGWKRVKGSEVCFRTVIS